MVNALKKQVQFNSEEDEELSGAPVSKSKLYLFAVFFVLLGVAAYSLIPDLEETREAGNVLKESVVLPVEEAENKPTLDKDKLDQSKQALAVERVKKGATQSEKKTLTFKSDPEYLAMNRFERPSLELKSPVVARQNVQETIDVVDKPLIFAGRGFDIQGFQSHASQVIQADFIQHLNRPIQKVKTVRLERLDLQLTEAKTSKYLIFHPLGPALSQRQKPVLWEKPEPPSKPHDLERIPETKLLFKENKKSQLILRPGNESLDLLIGHEKINRRDYGSW